MNALAAATCRDSGISNTRPFFKGEDGKLVLELDGICLAVLIVLLKHWCLQTDVSFFSQQKDQNPAECKQQWSSVYVALRITCTVIA